MNSTTERSSILGSAAIAVSLISQNVGAAFAKALFPVLGATGVAALRVALAASILVLVFRPWRYRLDRTLLPSLVAYGAALGLMNVLIYEAFARIPLGVALAIEVTGPLLVALGSGRRLVDFAWPLLALAGLALLLLPGDNSPALDPAGLLYAAGAALCWAGYILAGKRVSGLANGAAVACGMVIASCLVIPLGAPSVLIHLTPTLFGAALAVAALSSALPYSLEMFALSRLPAGTIGVLLSTAPAVGALAGLVVLREHLSPAQWGAIFLVVAASVGAAARAARRSRPVIEVQA